MIVADFEAALARLTAALRDAPHAQIALLEATDRLYAALEEGDEWLSDDQVLSGRLLIAQAEAILTRYFGM